MAVKKIQPDPQEILSLLNSCCERNISVEIHKHTGDAAVPVARARMMCTDSERLFLDEPQTIGKEVQMGKNTAVDVYFSLGDKLYTFATTIASMQCKVRLNQTKTLIGMAINLPKKIDQGQRRSRFRTSLALHTPIPVTLCEASGDCNSCPLDAFRFEGRIVDGSEGGLGILLEFDRPRKFKVFGRWIVEFHIPGESETTVLGCELRQVRTIRENELMKIGIMALPWPNTRAMRERMQPLARHLNSIERQFCQRAS
jgi:c-di-GMP-binding flagellar brake protein YcgR